VVVAEREVEDLYLREGGSSSHEALADLKVVEIALGHGLYSPI
jgi:hypothetical protein